MNNILVDSSVWVDHFKQPNALLIELSDQDRLVGHPLVWGEVACGTPPRRRAILRDLAELEPIAQVTIEEVVMFIEREQLFGLRCGLNDLMLLASTMMTPQVQLWTFDKPLGKLAERFGVRFNPLLN